MTAAISPATTWALGFLQQIIHLGVKHIVVSPGSRSQALALAADALSNLDTSDFQVHVCIDERTAGFYGLGLAIHNDAPTALLCTSGSAPAHYLPALLEAKHSGVPLIALTADRPAELRGVGSNQTTNQVGMFGAAVHASMDVPAPEHSHILEQQARRCAGDAVRLALCGAAGGRPGPVHVNIAFREPLSSPVIAQTAELSNKTPDATDYQDLPSVSPRKITLDPQPGTVVIAGHQAGPEAEELAQKLGAVLIAEVHSGAHFGKNLVVAYRECLFRQTRRAEKCS